MVVGDYDAVNLEESANPKFSKRNKNFWRIEYNFTSLYRLPGISVETLDSLSHRLQTNRSWFDTYFRTNNVNMEESLMVAADQLCPDAYCRRVHNCAISHVDYAEYQYCVERGDGFGGNEVIRLAYDVTSDAEISVKLFQALTVLSFLIHSIYIHVS